MIKIRKNKESSKLKIRSFNSATNRIDCTVMQCIENGQNGGGFRNKFLYNEDMTTIP